MADRDDIEGDIWNDGDAPPDAYFDEAADEALDETLDETRLENRAHGIWRDLWLATGFLTRLPLSGALTPPAYRDGRTPPPLARAARAFPLVGVIVGVLGALGIWVGAVLGLHPLGLAVLCLGVAALATGALHEDGLADVADGFGGGRDVDDKLEILRDSRIGTYGVLALVFSVGLRAAALISFATPTQAAFAFITAAVISRAGLPAMMHVMTPARSDGLGHGAGSPGQDGVITALVLAALIGFLFAGFGATVVGILFAAAAMAAVGFLAKRQIGGLTGDVLGAAQQAGELAVLVAAVWVLG